MAKRRKKQSRYAKLRLILSIIVLVLLIAAELTGNAPWDEENAGGDPNAQMEIHMIDVGQGESILVRSGQETMLVDAGVRGTGDEIAAYLQAQGIQKLDRLLITHDHSDHQGGLKRLLQDVDTDLLMLYDGGDRDSGYLLAGELAGSSSCDVAFMEKGQKFTLGDISITVVFPNAGYQNDNLNSMSVVLLLECGGKRVLLTGDSTAAAELQYYEELPRIDVLKLAHHGSGGSNSTEMLQHIRPTMALLSCGVDNDYGHPHKRVMQDLQDLGVAVYRTDEQGSLLLTLKDGTFTVTTQR